MSKHNYSQYSNKKNKATNRPEIDDIKTNVIETEPVVQPEPVVTEPAVQPKVEVPEAPKPVQPKLVEETVETVSLPEMVEGVVVNCAKLNVRSEPSITASIVCVLDAMSEIEIDVAKSNDEWFKICTAIGAEGYCMRKFVDAYL